MTVLRIGGIPVRLHVTFLLLVGAWLLATWTRSGPAATLDAAMWLAVLFGSVLLHEFGHAWVAHLHGIRTRAITLLPLGGAAQLEARRVTPKVDLVVSIAGPVTNLLIAAITIAIGLPLRSTPLLTIAAINLLLGGLNLVPAFPMDGGRVLRALLVPRHGLDRANQITLGLGFVFALGFGGLGVALREPGLVVLAVFLAVLQWRERKVQQILREHPELA